MLSSHCSLYVPIVKVAALPKLRLGQEVEMIVSITNPGEVPVTISFASGIELRKVTPRESLKHVPSESTLDLASMDRKLSTVDEGASQSAMRVSSQDSAAEALILPANLLHEVENASVSSAMVTSTILILYSLNSRLFRLR